MTEPFTLPDLYWLPVNAELDHAIRGLRGKSNDEAFAQLLKLVQCRHDYNQALQLDRRLSATVEFVPKTFPRIRIAMLSPSTVDHLLPSIRIALLRRGLLADIYTSPYGLNVQEILDPTSGLHDFNPEIVVLAVNHQSLDIRHDLQATTEDMRAIASKTVERWQHHWQILRERFGAKVIQHTLTVPPQSFGNLDALLPGSPSEIVSSLNAALRLAAAKDGASILDAERWSSRIGQAVWFDRNRWYQAKQAISPKIAPLYGDLVARIVAASRGMTAKCLVLDLDNTLWGGVIGDAGPTGIVLGQGSPAGEAYQDLQRYAKLLSERGVLLAVNSKNDFSNAIEPFQTNPDMVLREKDITCFVANWNDKASNCRQIATELNIGLDALVFFDDNPMERDWVREGAPAVKVPEVPLDPARFVESLIDSGLFEITSLTPDDLTRTQQYALNAERSRAQSASGSLEEYLASLEMKMLVGQVNEESLGRTVQLINKTNQFNLTTRRYTDAQVSAMAAQPGSFCTHLRLADKYGDNGIISIILATREPDQNLAIDTWVMSCRVLKRGVESATMNLIADFAASQGCKTITGKYVPTAKNAMVENHYPSLGFTRIALHEDGSADYRLELARYTTQPTVIATEIIK